MSKPALTRLHGGVLALAAPDMEMLLRAVLARNVPCRFQAGGQSMHPFIRDGDQVTVSPATVCGVQPGDVVAFVDTGGGMLMVHRVIAGAPGVFLLQGDNNPDRDGWIPAENILGRVTRVQRDGKRVRVGLGPERVLIAWLARRHLLRVFVNQGRRFLGPFMKGYAG